MSANYIRYRLIGEQSTRLITVSPQNGRLVRFFAPARKIACEACFTNTWFATGKDNPALPISCLVKRTLHASDFIFASDQLSLQNTVGVQLVRNGRLFGLNI